MFALNIIKSIDHGELEEEKWTAKCLHGGIPDLPNNVDPSIPFIICLKYIIDDKNYSHCSSYSEINISHTASLRVSTYAHVPYKLSSPNFEIEPLSKATIDVTTLP